MIHRRLPSRLALAPLALAAAALAGPSWAAGAPPAPSFLAVAAGDMTSDSAILWTRATVGGGSASGLTLELSTDAGFGTIAKSVGGLSTRDATYDYTLKVDVNQLSAGTKYYYRFSGGGASSSTGTFTTAPAANAGVAVRMGFSGDMDGLMRPYALTNNFSAAKPLNFFVNLGDTMYETASTGSPASFIPPTGNSLSATQLSNITSTYQTKYRENLMGVTAAGVACTPGSLGCSAQQGASALYANQGNYTLLDNHELGNRQYINGGAPIAALNLGSNGAKSTDGMDVNGSGGYVNQTAGFQAFMKAYNSYQPVRETLVNAPGDARSNGTQKQYFTQDWGTKLSFTNVDDRSYRDVRLKKADGSTDDTPNSYISGNAVNLPAVQRWNDPGRTMLGSTQLSWLEQSLSNQQAAGQIWKIVAVSSPIDQAGSAAGADGGKSWYSGYTAERNALLKYIDDHHITNVVFLSTDDHATRANELWYDLPGGGKKRLDSAFTIVTGPLGATGPDANASAAGHLFSNILARSNIINTRLALENQLLNGGQGGNQLGLKDFGGRISNVMRDQNGVLTAGSRNDAVNFVSDDTFAYTTLDVDVDGTLHVKVMGIDSYARNAFPTSAADPRVIFSFDVAATVPEPSQWAMMMLGLGVLGAAVRRRAPR